MPKFHRGAYSAVVVSAGTTPRRISVECARQIARW